MERPPVRIYRDAVPTARLDTATHPAPRSALPDVPPLPAAVLDRMHDLLERNTDAPLAGVERDELEILIALVQSDQIARLRE